MSETERIRPTTEGTERGSLNDIMDFDHMIRVHDDGTVSAVDNGPYMELNDGELSAPDGWRLMTGGFTGQYGYNGPIMHNSEYIGGGLARHILETPGLYVALVSHYRDCGDCEDIDDPYYICDNDHDEGWAIAYKEEI